MANVAKFTMKESARVIAHCSRNMKQLGSHIDIKRSEQNFNMAEGLHEGKSDYEFLKDKNFNGDAKRFNRDDVKDLCSWAVTMPLELCHEVFDENGESSHWEANDPEECREFFQHAYDFLCKKHGEQNVVSANVHMDENVPHMHFLFTPIVPDLKHPGETKVCAKEALADVYKAEFQIELQDYISANMGKQLHMVKQETVDYERNVKELKKKSLNQQCAFLKKEIAKLNEEIERKREVSSLYDVFSEMSQNPDIKIYEHDGIISVTGKSEDMQEILRISKLSRELEKKREYMKKILDDFENKNITAEMQSLEEQAKALSDENSALKLETDNFHEFLERAAAEYNIDIQTDFEEFMDKQKNRGRASAILQERWNLEL